MRGLIIVLVAIAGALCTDAAHAQDCANGQCSVVRQPRLAPVLPPLPRVMQSVVEALPARRVMAPQPVPTLRYVPVYVRPHVSQPPMPRRYSLRRFFCR